MPMNDDLDLTLATDEDLADPIGLLAAAGYRWQGLQIIQYDRRRTDIFPQPYLPMLYERTRRSGRSRLGSLPSLFCGMSDLSCDAICAYWHQVGLIVTGEWRAAPPIDGGWEDVLAEDFEERCRPRFHPLGYTFPAPSIIYSRDRLRNSAFAGYTFFEEVWGDSPKKTVLMYLGLAYLFQEFRLVNIHGVRYSDNKLTARFASQFGFRDLGTIPNYMLRESTGELADGTVSSLARKDFEDRLRGVLTSLREP